MKKERVIGFFSLFVFLISASFVSAQNQCSDDKYVILRISSETNAHGEVHDGAGNYNTEICYNKLFGESADIGETPWTCDGTVNTVLKLSSGTNAHASGPGGSYGTSICYSDLQCSLKQSCSGDEKAIVKLSSATNAHLELANGTNYANVICCSSAGSDGGEELCGDGIINGEDECDGTNLNGKTCAEGRGNGALSCKADCTFNYSGCSGQPLPPAPLDKKAYWGIKKDSLSPGIVPEKLFTMNDKIWIIARGFTLDKNVSFDIWDDDNAVDDSISENMIKVKAETWRQTTLATFEFNPNNHLAKLIEAGKTGDSDNHNILELYFIAKEGSDKETSQIIKLDRTPIAPLPVPTTGCAKYTSLGQGICEADANGGKTEEPSYDATKCSSSGWTCKCVWENSACAYKETFESPPGPDSGPGDGSGAVIQKHSCTTNMKFDGDCINEKITSVSHKIFTSTPANCSSWNTPADCNDAKTACESGEGQINEIPCGGSTLTLPFFGWMQGILSLFAIMIVYFCFAKNCQRREEF